MQRIYISATGQHAGKTATALGLYNLFEELGNTVNYIKPVGQRSLTYQGYEMDEDAVLFKEHLKCQTPLHALTAVTVPKGFTEQYIFNRQKALIYNAIDRAMMRLGANSDVTLIEGTGHAGVGSAFDASNAAVACLLGASAIIVAEGGIGSCLDQIALNQALFRQENVHIIGAVINKVHPQKYEKICRAVGQGLNNMGIDCLGVIPYNPDLTFPTVEQLVQNCKYKLVCGNEAQMQKHIKKKMIGALPPEKLIDRLQPETLLIVPGGSTEALMNHPLLFKNEQTCSPINAILFADGSTPSDE